MIQFLDALRADDDTRRILEEHIADNDEVLAPLLVGDLRRRAEELYARGDDDQLSALLEILNSALRDGDEYLNNAVAVSFVEDARIWDPTVQSFVESWPRDLTVEAERQRRWSQEHKHP